MHSLVLAKQRTILGTIGIMIGIGSIIAMISVGLIAKAESLKEFEELGTELLVIHSVRPPTGAPAAGIPHELAMGLSIEAPTIVQSAPQLGSRKALAYLGRKIGQGQINGVTSSFAKIVKLKLQKGRFISDLDDRSYFGVVGAEIASAMRRVTDGQIVGEVIKLDNQRYTIVGVLAETPKRNTLSLDINPNRSVFIPIRNAQRILPGKDIRTVVARSSRGVHYTVATTQIHAYFKGKAKGLHVSVDSATELIEQMEKQMQLLTLLLGTIGSIALIVGGIGIMNIMIASIAERKSEIGLRRALGARRSDIQGQFLAESVILCLLGGVLGTAVGVGGTYAVCHFTEWDFFVSWVSIALGIGTASGVGIFFGFQPAYQAARLDPIAALHSE